jgi:nucleotide-binding universal stress UspA family protein
MIESKINSILVPVDFSPASINALDTAIAMAKQHDARILLLNVVETSGLSGVQVDGCNADEAMIAMAHHSRQELITLQHSIIERFLVTCEIISATGIVSSTIIKTSASHRVDLIVMGTHGSSGFRGSFIGLNAFNVVKGAGCPVLTIPPGKKWESFKKILFPVRPIPAALEKYDFVRKIIAKNDAELKVLGLATDCERDVDLLKELAAQLNEKLKQDEVASTSYFKVGKNMAEEVLKIAALMEADLIVITATTDSTGSQLFVGPYTRQVINSSPYPVLSIKPIGENVHAAEGMQHNRETFTREMPLYN